MKSSLEIELVVFYFAVKVLYYFPDAAAAAIVRLPLLLFVWAEASAVNH